VVVGGWVGGPGVSPAPRPHLAHPRDFAAPRASILATDGTITDGPDPETQDVFGGFSVIDVPARDDALKWAAKLAVACRCAQEVREFLPDPPV
jgi:hypothetical protein